MQESNFQGQQANADLCSPQKLRQRRKLEIEDLTDRFAPRGRRAVRAGLRLKGVWLARAGFQPGERVAVIVVEPGIMQLRVIPESAEQDQAQVLLPQQRELVVQGTPHEALLARNPKED